MDDPKQFCNAMDTWAKACMTDLPTDADYKKEWRKKFRESWQFIRLAISKSCLLDRLIYGGETLRTEICPVHHGIWSGCSADALPKECNCRHGICVTGWQRNPGDPGSENSAIMLVKAVATPEGLQAVEKIDPPK